MSLDMITQALRIAVETSVAALPTTRPDAATLVP
jgi:hypothetical protein